MSIKDWCKKYNFQIILTLIAVILAGAPYLYGALAAPDGYFYNGLHALSPIDHHVYYSYLEQVEDGHLLFKDLYTSEPQPYAPLNIFWLLLGLIKKTFNFSSPLTFHLARLFFIFVFAYVAWQVIRYFVREIFWQKTALTLLLFASGWGGFLSPLIEKVWPARLDFHQFNPVDVWVAEANTFLTLYQSPHFIASLTLLLVIFYLIVRAVNEEKIKFSFLAGVAALLLFQFHPFHAITIFTVVGVYFFVLFAVRLAPLKNLLKHGLLFLVISLPSLGYYAWLLKNDWLSRLKMVQNLTISPNFMAIFLGYGFLMVLALLGVFWIIRKKQLNKKNIFLITWLAVQTLVIYIPINFQRRLSEGYHVVIVLLSVSGLMWLTAVMAKKLGLSLEQLWTKNKFLIAIIFLIFFCFSPVFNITRDIVLFKNHYKFFYLNHENVQAIAWLKENLREHDVVLADPVMGNFIPGLTGKTSFLGHGVETAFYEEKLGAVQWFFASQTSRQKRLNFLNNNGISYLYLNRADAAVSRITSEPVDYLAKAYENKEVVIYRVVK